MLARQSGVLLHISSLPSVHGIGDLGPAAHAFVRLLAETGQSVWQFLPLNPTAPGIGNSPYSSPSAFAGNTLFISPEQLLEQGIVTASDMERAGLALPGIDPNGWSRAGRVDFERIGAERRTLLQLAFERNSAQLDMDSGFRQFVADNARWLEDYARFATIKNEHGGAIWAEWPERLARRDKTALAEWDATHVAAMQSERFAQYLFHRQWAALRGLCSRLGVQLIGDMPIYVTHDSADVWANPRFFRLDEAGRPTAVAGVPPDYFSPTGQRWGNPLYDWDALRREEFSWWVRRVAHNLALFDCVRLDHFRGFAGYWEIPVAEETAINGRWTDAPGKELFAVLARALPHLPLIAEDLGVITPDVRELQHAMGFPGMAVLQFGFSGNLAENPHAPFMHRHNQAVYTGTHDNPPTRGWFAEASSQEERDTFARYTGVCPTPENAAETMTRLTLGSVAKLSVVPVQDILGLGMESRMNTPSTVTGNWAWRLHPGELDAGRMEWFAKAAALFGRHAGRR